MSEGSQVFQRGLPGSTQADAVNSFGHAGLLEEIKGKCQRVGASGSSIRARGIADFYRNPVVGTPTLSRQAKQGGTIPEHVKGISPLVLRTGTDRMLKPGLTRDLCHFIRKYSPSGPK
jgi:hypothetical protein